MLRNDPPKYLDRYVFEQTIAENFKTHQASKKFSRSVWEAEKCKIVCYTLVGSLPENAPPP